MFCPQCGQQQASDAARFCSRCGFRLEAVSGLLSTGGAPLAFPAQAAPAAESPKRKGVRLGGKLMLLGIFIASLMGMLHELVGTPEELPIIGAIVFLAGLMRLIYALLFEDGPYRRQGQPQQVYVPPSQFSPPPYEASALPPQQGVPARGYAAPRADTGEIVYRPSVTEGTTRLLDDEREGRAR